MSEDMKKGWDSKGFEAIKLKNHELSGSVGAFSQFMVGGAMTLAFFINCCCKTIFDDVSCESFW